MLFLSLTTALRRLWANDAFVYSLRVGLALFGVIALCKELDQMQLAIPLILGVIACALGETDDSWRGRLFGQSLIWALFVLVTLAVQLLVGIPWAFALMLGVLVFALTMLGALGERYRLIGYCSIVMIVYALITAEQSAAQPTRFWHNPALLLAGSVWYGVLSIVWSALFAHQPIQQRLANLYRLLGAYLELKSRLFEPVRGQDEEALRLEVARLNGQVVAALNAAKDSIFSRVGQARPGQRTSRYLRLYFIAQDVHERATSTHYPYADLTDAFFHSDVMFRCQRLLRLAGEDCRRLARAIRMRQPYGLRAETQQAKEDLDASIQFLKASPDWSNSRLLRAILALGGNLDQLDRRLSMATRLDQRDDQQDISLLDRSPQSLKDAWDRVRLQLTRSAPIFRHACRLTLALLAGYGLVHLTNAEQGYWIVMTTLFVCSPSYGATKNRMVQRIAGTTLGLVLGWMAFRLFLSLEVQAWIAALAGVVFFATRSSRYMLGTASITLLVLLCLNQISDGYDYFLPRLVDTLIGSALAGLAVLVILPDWQGRRLSAVVGQAVLSSARYLQAVITQYGGSGAADDLNYRLARRNAHNADAAFSMTMSNMLSEPGHFRQNAELGLRLLVLSHTILNYISALGAHRVALGEDASDPALDTARTGILNALDAIGQALAQGETLPGRHLEEEALLEMLEQLPESNDDAHRIVHTQLALIARLLPVLRKQASRLLSQERYNPDDAGPDSNAAAGGAASPPSGETPTMEAVR
ncbi:MAG: YccS family putative transporter [Pigmentiphaga sp.]